MAVRVPDASLTVVDHPFHQTVCAGLYGSALDLTFDEHRVERPPDILSGDEVQQLDATRFGIDFDSRDVDCIRRVAGDGTEDRCADDRSFCGSVCVVGDIGEVDVLVG